VRDDGAGFDPRDAHGGTGLTGMRDRLGAFGGRLTIDTALGSGTAVHGAIPVAADPAKSPRREPEAAAGD
jgi:signal transduction histidine kinase